MSYYLLSNENIKGLINAVVQKNWNVVSGSADGSKYVFINDGKNVELNSSKRPPNISMKEYFFPRTEPLFYFKKFIDNLELIDPLFIDKKTLIFGAKPCDAAAVPVLEKVFNWDYKDEFFNARKDNTVVVGMSCNYRDEFCFCESVGLSPDSEKGSDIFLYPLNEQEYFVHEVTEKGKIFIDEFGTFFIKSESDELIDQITKKDIQKHFEYSNVKNWLDNNFNNEFWSSLGDKCIGCAQCAYVCPTCHCFDIVDEDCDFNCGRRVKNWDACQFALFTKHASGHNPRDHQGERYRQRINHKFKYYQDRFGEILCTGCGRCSRGCSVGMDISEILQEINNKQLNHG